MHAVMHLCRKEADLLYSFLWCKVKGGLALAIWMQGYMLACGL